MNIYLKNKDLEVRVLEKDNYNNEGNDSYNQY